MGKRKYFLLTSVGKKAIYFATCLFIQNTERLTLRCLLYAHIEIMQIPIWLFRISAFSEWFVDNLREIANLQQKEY